MLLRYPCAHAKESFNGITRLPEKRVVNFPFCNVLALFDYTSYDIVNPAADVWGTILLRAQQGVSGLCNHKGG